MLPPRFLGTGIQYANRSFPNGWIRMFEQQLTAGGIKIATTHCTRFDGLQASAGPLLALQQGIEDPGAFLREITGPALEQGIG